MTDLTLNEYRGIPEEELEKTLHEESGIIGGRDSSENYFKEPVSSLHLFALPLHYWAKFTAFISSLYTPVKDHSS